MLTFVAILSIAFVYAILLLIVAIASYLGFLLWVNSKQNVISKAFTYIIGNEVFSRKSNIRLFGLSVVITVVILVLSAIKGVM